MALPGFNAEAALYRPVRHYAGMPACDVPGGVIPAAGPPGFETCLLPCINYYMAVPNADLGRIIASCAIACGMAQAAAKTAFEAWAGLYGPGTALEGGGAAIGGAGGFLAPEAFGLSGGAALGLGAFALLAIALAAHDLYKGTGGPTQQPAATPAGCTGGSYDPSENITGWSVPLMYPGCAGAWDHSQVNAQSVCDAHLACSGTCANGRPCKSVAILIDRVDETRYGVTCRAEGKYTCQCACQ